MNRESELARDRAISNWSEGYFGIDADGRVFASPSGQEGPRIDLTSLAEEIRATGLDLPVLVRFADILRHRVNQLCSAFQEQAERLQYTGGFEAVYPIKVNQQRRVVEEILAAEPAVSRRQVGLEAGSKPELLAVLAMNPPGCTIVCNGYKDRAFIRLALLAQKLGHRVYLVIEKPGELDLIREEAHSLGVQPTLGVRARLSSIGKGNWQNTGGEKSKFGLSARQILALVKKLRDAEQLNWLVLLHFHLGSQIANIRDIQTGLRECGRYYSELRRLGVPIATIDVGGGLGIDYEGTRSRSVCSVNYSMRDYALHVLRTFREACEPDGWPHPDIIAESGRAMTAHHAVLITNVIDREAGSSQAPVAEPPEPAIPALSDLYQAYAALASGDHDRALQELYTDATHALDEARTAFVMGLIDLEARAWSEDCHRALCASLIDRLDLRSRSQREIYGQLCERLAAKLFVNFSLFQSLPDVWGIDQVFPVLALTGNNDDGHHRAVIQDITCDSDGRIDHYADRGGLDSSMHYPVVGDEEGCIQDDAAGQVPESVRKNWPLLGFFLTGAYQEILGDLHNLFGDTHAVDLHLLSDAANKTGTSYTLRNPTRGDSVEAVLSSVHYSRDFLSCRYRDKAGQTGLSREESKQIIDELISSLDSYTYFK